MKKSEQTKINIVKAAEEEFSQKGFYGARIDEIAQRAEVNKRMIYAYYESKENLYKTVLLNVYLKLSELEKSLDFSSFNPSNALRALIREYFYYLDKNPSFVNLILWENLNHGQYINQIDIFEIKQPGLILAESIIRRGMACGAFCEEVDLEQILLSINMFCFTYFSNRYTATKALDITFDSMAHMEKRIQHVSDMILCYLKSRS